MDSTAPHAPSTRPPSFAGAYILALILAFVLIVWGIVMAAIGTNGDYKWIVLAIGAASLVAVLLLWPLAGALRRAHGQRASQQAMVQLLEEQLRHQSTLLEMISEQQLISDRAKAIAFREKDREALRRAIEEEISRQDWEAAMVLAGEIEKQFGNRQEADRFRQQIVQGRRQIVRQQVDQAIEAVDKQVRAEQWVQARKEADRIAAAFPDDEQARQLPLEVHNRQLQHKERLMASWREAVARKDTDGGIEILKQLDNYLTPQEAQALQETARTVFKDKLNSLRMQFTAAVQADRWHEALDVGETIVTDFPNTRIAQEILQKMESLRKRAAGEPATAGA